MCVAAVAAVSRRITSTQPGAANDSKKNHVHALVIAVECEDVHAYHPSASVSVVPRLQYGNFSVQRGLQ